MNQTLELKKLLNQNNVLGLFEDNIRKGEVWTPEEYYRKMETGILRFDIAITGAFSKYAEESTFWSKLNDAWRAKLFSDLSMEENEL